MSAARQSAGLAGLQQESRAGPRYPGLGLITLILTATGILSCLRHFVYRQPQSALEMAAAMTACTVFFYPWIALTPLVFRLEQRFPLGSQRWLRNALVLALLSIPVSVLAAPVMSALYWAVMAAADIGVPYLKPKVFWLGHFFSAQVLFWCSVAGGYTVRTRHLLITAPAQGYAHLGMNGGLVGGRYDGLNQHGLFVSLHKVMADRPLSHAPGVPYHLLPRLALQTCRTATEAADLMSHLPHLASFNYLLADASGQMIALECYPGRKPERRESDEVLAVTNHYTSPMLAPLQGARPKHDSQRRMAALESIHDRWGDGWYATFDALADHDSGVCSHREFGATLWAGVFDLGAKRAGYTFGAPCRNEVINYQLAMSNEQ